MNYKRLNILFHELSKKIENQHTLYLDSISGYSILHERILKKQADIKSILGNHECASTEFQDTCSTIYKQFADKDYRPVSMSPVMKQGDVKSRTNINGQNYLMLGEQCIVSMFSYWEEYLRLEIGIAIGVLPENAKPTKKNKEILNVHVTSNIWGDIRYLRNSIVHNNSVAIKEMSKCKIITCFPPGNEIRLTYEVMELLFVLMGYYRNDLHTMSLPPRKGIRLPGKKC